MSTNFFFFHFLTLKSVKSFASSKIQRVKINQRLVSQMKSESYLLIINLNDMKGLFRGFEIRGKGNYRKGKENAMARLRISQRIVK